MSPVTAPTAPNVALAGPWVAVLSDLHGFVYESFEDALEDLGEDHDEEMRISVRRGSASPVERFGNLRTPGSYSSGDLVYEIEAWLVDPDDPSVGAEARYVQALAMAAGLNAGLGQRPDGGEGGNVTDGGEPS